MMAGIKSKNTAPEMSVRKYLHAQGFRYRLHARGLPGSPDLVLPKHRVAIFVHGCFWHRHTACRYATTPSSNVERWTIKFQANVERDVRNEAALRTAGWRVIVVWECELRRNSINRLERLVTEIMHPESTDAKSPSSHRTADIQPLKLATTGKLGN
jgi:DNA mismatch endonuclease (patch repair protein)